MNAGCGTNCMTLDQSEGGSPLSELNASPSALENEDDEEYGLVVSALVRYGIWQEKSWVQIAKVSGGE